MNNTKWNEIFRTFFSLECSNEPSFSVHWQTKDRSSGFISSWDATWSHFGCHPTDYEEIEWLIIQLTEENRDFVLKTLHDIHVPGEAGEDEVIVYGYRTDVDYL